MTSLILAAALALQSPHHRPLPDPLAPPTPARQAKAQRLRRYRSWNQGRRPTAPPMQMTFDEAGRFVWENRDFLKRLRQSR